jgi:Ca2+-binding RTX toxin-like protein
LTSIPASVGIDYVVTAATTNTPNAQTLSIGVADGGDYAATIVWNGTTYSLAQVANANQSGLTAFLAAVVTAGGTSSVSTNVADGAAGTEVITISGAVPLITQVTAGTGASSVALAVDVQTTQANPTVATETLARSVIGAADTINGGAGDDNITGLVGADILDGGAGLDTVNYQLSLAAVNVNLATNVVSGGDAQGDVITNFENITGTVYADTLTGSSAANVINGGAGNDTISSAEGDDTITAGEGADIVNGGAGVDIITLGTETTSAADRVTSDAAVAANADSIVGFASGTDKFAYTGTLQNALGTNSDGVAGTDVITAATLLAGLTDANSTAGVVFIAQTNVANNGTNLQGDAFTALLGATTAATIASTYATLEAALIATGGTLNGVITGLDTVLITTDSALLVLDNGTGSVVLRITNSVIDATTANTNTLTAAEIELVGVFTNTAALAAGDFI